MAATLQLEDKLLVREGCSVVDTSTVEPAGRQEGQHIAAAAIHQEGNEREQSPLGNSTVLGSLGSKESNLLGVRIV